MRKKMEFTRIICGCVKNKLNDWAIWVEARKTSKHSGILLNSIPHHSARSTLIKKPRHFTETVCDSGMEEWKVLKETIC